MSEKLFVDQIQPGKRFITFFYVDEKNLKTTRQGKTFLDLKLKDRTGAINGKIWDFADKFSTEFERDQYVKVKGMAESYQGNLQLKIEKIRQAADNEIDEGDYLPVCEKDVDAMYRELLGYMESIKNPWIKKLLESFFSDDDFSKNYIRTPAAKSVHHTYIGGLLDHTLSMVQICDFLANHYGDLDRDLLLCGAILHDLGKLRELKTGAVFSYTDEGELIGHTVLGVMMIQEKILQIPDFPPNLAMLIEHMILSHQGAPEWGAPKRPLFKEALVLHYVDDIDAKMNLIRSFMPERPEGGEHETPAVEGSSGTADLWSDKCWFLDNRRFLDIKRFFTVE